MTTPPPTADDFGFDVDAIYTDAACGEHVHPVNVMAVCRRLCGAVTELNRLRTENRELLERCGETA